MGPSRFDCVSVVQPRRIWNIAPPSTSSLSEVLVPLLRVVRKEFIDQIDMGHEHTPTAVSLAAELVHGVAVFHALLDQLEIFFVEVGYDLWTVLD